MNKEQVVGKLIEILKECQKALGHDDGDSITGATVPHGGLKGFQSDVTPTLVRRLARRLDPETARRSGSDPATGRLVDVVRHRRARRHGPRLRAVAAAALVAAADGALRP